MSELQRRHHYERNDVSSPISDPEIGHITENGLIDDKYYDDSPENFVPHVITRMPDLTGYGGEVSPQNISLYRPKRKGMKLNFEFLKGISVQKWCAGAAICIVAATVIWSFAHTPKEDASVKPDPQTARVEPPSDRPLVAAGENRLLFPGLNADSTGDNAAASASRNDHFGARSIVPADSATTGSPQFSEGFSGTGIASNASSREAMPWDHQPNQQQPSGGQALFGVSAANEFPVNSATHIPAAPAESWQNYSQFAGTDTQPNATAASSQGYFGQQQPGISPNAQPGGQFNGQINGQFGPATQPQGQYANVTMPPNGFNGDFNNGFNQGTNGGLAAQTGPGFAGGYSAPYQENQPYAHAVAQQGGITYQPQQAQYQNSPVAHDNAVALNTGGNMTAYSQGQGQLQQGQQTTWQQGANVPQQYATQPQAMQTQYGNMPSQNGIQIAMQPNASNGYANGYSNGHSNVPVPASEQSFRDPSVTGTNLSDTMNQYPVNQYSYPGGSTQPSYR